MPMHDSVMRVATSQLSSIKLHALLKLDNTKSAYCEATTWRDQTPEASRPAGEAIKNNCYVQVMLLRTIMYQNGKPSNINIVTGLCETAVARQIDA
jgi:hypothetical protein